MCSALRIGSSKRNIKDYPKREVQLFKILTGLVETIETIPAKYQDLSFKKLFGYYGSKGILLKRETFEKNLLLRTKTGESVPVNEKLSEIFLQLHISEKSGRGVPKIVETYGREAFTFRENSIVVTIPFNRIHQVGKKLGSKSTDRVSVRKPLNERRKLILSEMRDNPNITKAELQKILKISGTAVDNNIAFLRRNGYIERIGSRRGGYWNVIDKE